MSLRQTDVSFHAGVTLADSPAYAGINGGDECKTVLPGRSLRGSRLTMTAIQQQRKRDKKKFEK